MISVQAQVHSVHCTFKYIRDLWHGRIKVVGILHRIGAEGGMRGTIYSNR